MPGDFVKVKVSLLNKVNNIYKSIWIIQIHIS